MLKYRLILLLITGCFLASAQPKQGQSRIDSLLIVYQRDSSKIDTTSIQLLIAVSYEYYKIDPEKGIYYGERAMANSMLIQWKQGIASAGNRIGLCYWAKADYPKSLEYHYAALKLAEEINDKEIIATICGNIGLVYVDQQHYDKALEFQFRGRKLYQELDNKSGIARCLGNIGIVYDAQGQYDRALEYYSNASALYETLNDKGGVARNLGNSGFVYQELNNHAKALQSYFKALQMNRETGNKILTAQNLGNIGEEYFNIYNDTVKSRITLLPDSLQKNILPHAEYYLKASIAIFEEINELNSLQELYKYLSDIKAIKGDYAESLTIYKKHIAARDSVFSESNKRKISNLEKTREEDLKQKQIELLTKQNEIERLVAQRRKSINYGLGGAFVLLGFLTVSFFRQNKKRKAVNRELRKAYAELEGTQAELVKSEKLAAFGIMASRVSHEIQNPLNFVNNFSAMSEDLVKEIMQSSDEKNKQEAAEILLENLKKINYHGLRADSIVKQLQEHTKAGTANEFFEN
jgi:two-component system NtrC family sensor kinase